MRAFCELDVHSAWPIQQTNKRCLFDMYSLFMHQAHAESGKLITGAEPLSKNISSKGSGVIVAQIHPCQRRK
jgi:hypothetical protein